MSWVRISDDMLANNKIRAAGRDAYLLYMAALQFCHQSGDAEGFVPDWRLPDLARECWVDDLEAAVDHLLKTFRPLKNPLWRRVEGGYLIHDYQDYLPKNVGSRPTDEELSAMRAQAGREGGKRSGASRRSKSEAKRSEVEASSETKSKELDYDTESKQDEAASSNAQATGNQDLGKSLSKQEPLHEANTLPDAKQNVKQTGSKNEAPNPIPNPVPESEPDPEPEPKAINTAAAENLAPAREEAQLSAEEADLLRKLTSEFGNRPALERSDALRLLCAPRSDGKSPLAVIRQQLRYWPYRQPGTSPRPFLIKAIDEDWAPPPGWIDAKKRHDEEAEKRREREQTQAEAERQKADFNAWWSELSPEKRREAEKRALAALSRNPALKSSIKRCQADGVDLLAHQPISGAYQTALYEAVAELKGGRE